ncbi:hypothetical protein [Pontimicrobium sp. SW4]|uniref:Uncharacterized protein n=1 Tax=Pontimicrobium sp. SW4 TaxID=3153519 RepID=A0AAU7BVA3_9FLAO
MKSTQSNVNTLNIVRSHIKSPPKLQLYLMRAIYLLTFISLAFDNWSTIFFPSEQLDTLSGVAISFWASYSLLMGLGVRYPLKMLPLILLQLLYKFAWIIGVYLPAKSAGLLNSSLEEFFKICLIAVIIDLIIIPWSYTYKIYIANFFNFKKSSIKN